MNSLFHNLKHTMSFLKGHYVQYSIGIIGKTIVESLAVLIESYLLKVFFDAGTTDSIYTIMKMFAWVLFYVVIILLLNPLFTIWFNGNAKYGHGNVNKAIYKKFGDLPVKYYEQNHSGSVMSIFLNDSWVMSAVFMRHFRRVIASFVTIVIYLIPMLVMDWRITCIIFSLNLLTLIVNEKLAKVMKKKTRIIQKNMEDLTVSITNLVSGMSIIRMYEMSRKMTKDLKHNNQNIASLELDRAKVVSGLAAYNYSIYIISIVVFLMLGSYMVSIGLTTFGAILSIMSLQTAMDANFREFGEYYPQFFNGLAATERIFEFFDEPNETEEGNCATTVSLENNVEPECSVDQIYKKKKESTAVQSQNIHPYIEMEDVSFSYDEKNMVLQHFSMQVQKGEHVALIGESGSGKSSIAKILLGFYPIQQGNVSVAGVSVNQLSLHDLREKIAYVPQEPAIFAMTVMENIRYGKPGASDEDVIRAAKQADAYEFIMQLEHGFDTQVGEEGVKLSGGQRQRIAISRAFLKDAPILLLDEATSALDNVTEQKIISTLNRYGKDKTMITIAHRKSSIEGADRVIAVDQ